MSDLIITGVAAFAAGLFCGTAVVGPKLYAAVTGTLDEMSHDLNPHRDSPPA